MQAVVYSKQLNIADSSVQCKIYNLAGSNIVNISLQ